MFTNNWYKALSVGVSGQYISLIGSDGNVGSAVFDSTSVSNKIRDAFKNGVKTGYNSGSNNSSYIVLGTGNETPTMSDYKFSGSVVSGITTTISFTGNNTNDYTEGSGIITITNGNSTDITIGEIGIMYLSGTNAAMLEHTALESPVTIPAGGIGQVTYTIRMNYPTA